MDINTTGKNNMSTTGTVNQSKLDGSMDANIGEGSI